MGLHIPSFLVGSIFAGSGFLLIHRELSHRRRLTTKWVVQEYVEESWREWRKSSAANQIEDAKVSMHVCLLYLCVVYIAISIYLYRRPWISHTQLQHNIKQKQHTWHTNKLYSSKQKNFVAPINNISASPAELTSTWNKGIASLRDLLSQKKDW